MGTQVNTDREIIVNEKFLKVAEDLLPELVMKKVYPQSIVETKKDNQAVHGWSADVVGGAEAIENQSFGKGEQFILDFGDHTVGYLQMEVEPEGSPPDAPLHLKLTFGEMPVEVSEPFESYDGWISSSWLQEETLHIDILPGSIKLPRRFSFRYLKVDVLDTSVKYKVSFKNICADTVTSAQKPCSTMPHLDEELVKIDAVSLKTLKDCMQEVFEDGPKRDRRLWLGDLRLQALTNYGTFQNNDLVKRCLYLFAAVPDEEGRIAANVFIKPELIADDTYLFDYSLFFLTSLSDYFFMTGDQQTLDDLWPSAYKQVENALGRVDESGIVEDDTSWWSFIDWNEKLNKQAASQGVLVYALKKAEKLARVVGDEKEHFIKDKREVVSEAARNHLFDEDQFLFVSGADRQVSWASQIWMVIAGLLPPEDNRMVMNRLFEVDPAIKLNTPYMYHHLVEALCIVGEKEKAEEVLKGYWGRMVKDGADTFWELYNPEDKNYSPYGGHLINSYCHAWSCTPAYLLRNYQF